MNNVLEIEILLNMLNTVFAKAVSFKDEEIIKEINAMRHSIYYGSFDYENDIKKLKEMDIILNKYE